VAPLRQNIEEAKKRSRKTLLAFTEEVRVGVDRVCNGAVGGQAEGGKGDKETSNYARRNHQRGESKRKQPTKREKKERDSINQKSWS